MLWLENWEDYKGNEKFNTIYKSYVESKDKAEKEQRLKLALSIIKRKIEQYKQQLKDINIDTIIKDVTEGLELKKKDFHSVENLNYITKIIRSSSKKYGINSVNLRYFNVAGADPDGQIGEFHRPETHLIPIILNSLLDHRKQVKVFGNDYETADGTCIRDYVHVNDVVNSYKLFLTTNTHGVINVGSGKGKSVKSILEFLKLEGINKFNIKNHNKLEVERSVANINKLSDVIDCNNFTDIYDYVALKLKKGLEMEIN